MVTRRDQAVVCIAAGERIGTMANAGGEECDRPFGFWTALALIMGGMIGAGIFVLPSQLAPFGTTGLVAWLVAGVGVTLIGLVVAALVQSRPEALGLVSLCGEVLGPLAGLLIGWSYWTATWASLAVLGGAASSYLALYWPLLAKSPLHIAISSITIIWLLTLLNLRGVRSAGRFQVLSTALKLIPLIAVLLVLAGLVLGGAAVSLQPQAPFQLGQMSAALILVIFALLGFESAGAASGSIRNCARNVPLATMTGVILVGGLYFVVSTGIGLTMPGAALARSGSPIADFVAQFWGSGAGMAVAAFAAISAIGCLNGWVLIQGEMPLGMVREGLLPGWIGHRNRAGVAWVPIVASSLLASLLVLSNVSRGTAGLFAFMMQLTATASLFVYASVCLTALRCGVMRPVALVALAFACWTLWGAGLEVTLLGVALMLTALPLYWMRPRPMIAAAS
jgi:basic amino acid/polyamine antiporter, APA family